MLRGECVILDQDLMEWIIADKKIPGGTGLLLVPTSPDSQKIIPVIEPSLEEFILGVYNGEESKSQEPEPEEEAPIEIPAEANTSSPQDIELESQPDVEEISQDEDLEDLDEELGDSQEEFAPFEINLNEPPPELWTKINPEDYDSEDEDVAYEQGMSLQGAAYVPKNSEREQNFTDRLHQFLRWRKQKAEQIREEEEKKSRHPYRIKALIICTALLATIGLAYAALYFLQQWAAEKIHEKVQAEILESAQESTPVQPEEKDSQEEEIKEIKIKEEPEEKIPEKDSEIKEKIIKEKLEAIEDKIDKLDKKINRQEERIREENTQREINRRNTVEKNRGGTTL